MKAEVARSPEVSAIIRSNNGVTSKNNSASSAPLTEPKTPQQ
jgi:hypothetical protein